MKKIFLIIPLLAMLASCQKEENVTPIFNEGETVFCLGNTDEGKYAYNGRTHTYVFHHGDRIQIGAGQYGLTYLSQSQASVERCPQVTTSNTIFPAEYVTGMCGDIPQITVPEKMRFSKYGTWDGNLYCPQRVRSQSGNRVELTPIFVMADYNVSITNNYCEAHGVTYVIIDSVVLTSAYPCAGMAHLSGGTAVFHSITNHLVLIPHSEESATACLDSQEAILGYAYFPGFTILKVYWHNGHMTGCKTIPYSRNLVTINGGNVNRMTLNIPL